MRSTGRRGRREPGLSVTAPMLALRRMNQPSHSQAAELPPELTDALGEDPGARAAFESLPPSHQMEYVKWIREAKRDDTRATRAAKTIAMLREGKSRS